MTGNELGLNDPSKHTICIIGAGASGYRFFAECVHLLGEHRLAESVRLVMIDRRDFSEFGRGVAWSSDQSHLLRANMHTPTIVFDLRDQDKLARLFELDKEEVLTDGLLFDRRKRIGDVLANAFQKVWGEAEQLDIERHAIQDNAIRISRSGIGYRVECESGRSIFANTIVLGLGHFPPTNFPELYGIPGYVRNVWKWSELDNLDPSKKVAIVGLGPTAVDALILLRSKGFKQIHAFSKSGTMQYPRPRPIRQTRVVLTEDRLREVSQITNGLRFDGVMALMAAEFSQNKIDWNSLKLAVMNSFQHPNYSLKAGLANSHIESDWFGMLKSIDDVVPLIWSLMPEQEKQRYLKYRRVHTNISYGMAPPQAIRVLQEIEERNFVVSGGLERLSFNEKEGLFEVHLDRKGEENKFNYIIDCSGIGADIENSDWPLIDNMLKDGWLFKHPYGGTFCDFETGKLLDGQGKKVGEIYSIVGSLTYGTRLLTNCINEVAKSAIRTADAVIGKIVTDLGSVRQPIRP